MPCEKGESDLRRDLGVETKSVVCLIDGCLCLILNRGILLGPSTRYVLLLKSRVSVLDVLFSFLSVTEVL
jgi:hypothetical protein